MEFFNQDITDKLRDLESPLNERVSFDEVMKRREKKKRRAFFYWPRIVVVAGLFSAAGYGFYAWTTQHGKPKATVVLAGNRTSKKSNHPPTKTIDAIENVSNTTEEFNDNLSAKKIVLGKSQSSIGKESSKITKEVTVVSAEVSAVVPINSGSNEIQSKVAVTEMPTKLETAVETKSLNEKLNNARLELLNLTNVAPIVPEIKQLSEDPNIVQTESATKPVSKIPETSVAAIISPTETNDLNEEQIEIAADRIRIDRLMELSHGKGLALFEIPNPLSVSDFNAIFIETEGDEISNYFKPGNFNSPYHIELSVGTGSRVLMNFDETVPLSILGSQYNAHYQLSVLKDMSSGIQLGVGALYGEWIGTGQWQKRQWNSYTVRDSSVLIGFPNPNDRQVVYFDSVINELTTTQGGISYQINKFSIPIGFRKLMNVGKTPFRFALQLAPGRTVKTTGLYFSEFEYHSIANQKLTTMDLKLAIGPAISINRNYTFILEPNANLQTFHDSRTGEVHSKSFWGFGFSLIRHIN